MITFGIEGPAIQSKTRRKMNEVQKADFARETRRLANSLMPESRGQINVDTIEDLSTKLVQGLVNVYKAHSTEYHVKIREKVNLWFHDGLTAERRKHATLKHLYEHDKSNPAKRTAWKDQEQRLTALYKKA